MMLIQNGWKYIEVVNSLTSWAMLVSMFARFGLPKAIVSDNATCFTSSEFIQLNGVKLIHISPFHPSTNGLAERAVQIFKLG